LPFALQVKAAGISRAIRLKIREYCAAHQATSYLIEGAGAWDFQIGIRPTDMRAPTVIAEDILRTFAPHVTKVTTIPIHDCLKLVPYPLAEAWPMKRVRAAND
jgi:hypothetical protein